MTKCQNAMVLFSYPRLLLSHMLINKRSGSEEGCLNQFLLHTRPLKPHPSLCLLLSHYSCPHCRTLCLPLSHDLHPPLRYVPLLLPILNLHVFPHICPLKIHPYLCLPLSHSSCPYCIPICLPLSRDLRPPPPLPLFLPFPLHSYDLHIPLYHLHLNHRIQIIQWLASLMPLVYVSLL